MNVVATKRKFDERQARRVKDKISNEEGGKIGGKEKERIAALSQC